MTAQPEELLEQLVAIPSVSGDEQGMSDFAFALLDGAGLEVERLGPTLLACVEPGPGPRVLFNSHLDTVPAGDGWTREPFAATWEGDRLYGRGSNDAKASVAALLWSALDWAASPQRGDATRGSVWLALTACEETSNAGMQTIVDHFGLPDAAVTGEPTGLEVVRAQAGLAVLTAEWSGRACHAAHVDHVEHSNALALATSDLAGFGGHRVFEHEGKLIARSTVAATVLQAGSTSNVVPDSARAVFDARLAPELAASDVARLLADELPSAKVSIRSERLRPVETAEDHPWVRAALACAGRDVAVGSKTLSDMALLPGVAAVKCGPGQTSRSHTPDEYCTRDEVRAGAKFYRALIPRALQACEEMES